MVKAKTEPPPEPEEAPVSTTSVQEVSGWHLVRFGTWEVSVAPDGLLMLPRHVAPHEITDFVGAMLAAAEIGARVKAENDERAKNDARRTPPGRVSPRAGVGGTLPPGMMQPPMQPGPNTPQRPQRTAATIGRPERYGGRQGTAY